MSKTITICYVEYMSINPDVLNKMVRLCGPSIVFDDYDSLYITATSEKIGIEDNDIQYLLATVGELVDNELVEPGLTYTIENNGIAKITDKYIEANDNYSIIKRFSTFEYVSDYSIPNTQGHALVTLDNNDTVYRIFPYSL